MQRYAIYHQGQLLFSNAKRSVALNYAKTIVSSGTCHSALLYDTHLFRAISLIYQDSSKTVITSLPHNFSKLLSLYRFHSPRL